MNSANANRDGITPHQADARRKRGSLVFSGVEITDKHRLRWLYTTSDKFLQEFVALEGVGTDTDCVMNAIFAQAHEEIKRNSY
jgi:hypothetical protein